jgi:type IV fimbrial biogenesis protein FimT
MHRPMLGFTLIEMLIVLAVAALLATLVAPSFNETLARRRLEGVATDLSTDLQFARTQAVDDRNTVQLVTENGGTRYRVVNAAGTTLKTVDFPTGITANIITVTYDQLRGTANAAQVTLSYTPRTTAQMRVDTNVMGRVSICTIGGTLKGYTTCT